MASGTVVKKDNGFYYVTLLGDNKAAEETLPVVVCKLRGKLKREKNSVVIGDKVEYVPMPPDGGVIERIYPRTNLIRRPLVANVQQAVVVFAVKDPLPHPLLIDRFLVLMEWSGLKNIILCFNKIDLAAADELAVLKKKAAVYEKIGYNVLLVAAKKKENIIALKERLKGKISVFAGPSGVGKSSIGNVLDETLELATGTLSEKIQRGKHTTRAARLLPLHLSNGIESGQAKNHESYIVDTPGFSALDILTKITPDELGKFFPEYLPYLGKCFYRGCRHRKEPDCAIKNAVAEGKIETSRYESYLAILDDIEERKDAKW